MADFFQLSTAERLDVLDAAANISGLLPHLLEKDIWVVWSLRHLFAGPFAENLVFKGGTSLSKAYGVIRRFSEDVDLTYDIRAIAGDLVGDAAAPLVDATIIAAPPAVQNREEARDPAMNQTKKGNQWTAYRDLIGRSRGRIGLETPGRDLRASHFFILVILRHYT